MKKPKDISIGKRKIGVGRPSYIIAEVGSNFDGSLKRAKKLAKQAKEAGADAYKIQNFLAPKIVSSQGFKNLQVSFQSSWDRPVVEVYKKAEFPRKWIKEVSDYCQKIGIDFLSSPYDLEAVDALEKIGMKAYKLGSGEIDNLDFLEYIAKKRKPMIIATGSATLKEVELAVKTIRKAGNNKIVLLQCVTNYPSPVKDSNLEAMNAMGDKFGTLVGYSDHTIGPSGGGDDPLGGMTVPLGAIARGAVMIEKHFTDDKKRKGPDHPFAIELPEFKKMIEAIKAMESAMGDGKKRVMPSEKETVVIQRRGIYAKQDIKKGQKISKTMVEYLRPAVGFRPPQIKLLSSKRAKRDIQAGSPIKTEDVN